MCVPRNDGGETGRFRVQIEAREIVKNVKTQMPGFDDVCEGQCFGPEPSVDVATHGHGRRDRSEVFEYLRVADVAGMNDQL